MSIPKFALQDGGQALSQVIGGYLKSLSDIKDFEQNSDLDDIIGKSVLSTKDKPFHYSTKEGASTGGKRGVAEESIEGMRKSYDELQLARSIQYKDLKKSTLNAEEEYMKVMNVYESGAILPTYGPILNTWAEMKVGDKGYNKYIVDAAKELQRTRNILADFSSKDNQQVQNLSRLRADISTVRGEAMNHPQMKDYFNLKNSLEANKETLSKMVPDEQDYADIMTAVLDAATYGAFSIQNGIIYLPEIDSLDDADPFAKDYEAEGARKMGPYSEDVSDKFGKWWGGSVATEPILGYFPELRPRRNVDKGNFDWWKGSHEIDSPFSGQNRPS
jgi:hypothetical protein